MLAAALRDGTAGRTTSFEMFTRHLGAARRYGVLAGTDRLLQALPEFRFDADAVNLLAEFLDPSTLAFLSDFRFRGDIDGYPEGELYFAESPVLTVRGTFAECVVLETLALSMFNHDSAIAAAAARMVIAADGRPLIEMGSRRTHEQAAVAAARSAYLAGFAGTSNVQAHRRFAVPVLGTSAHSFTLLHTGADGEAAAFRAQVAAQGVGTTLLVDTYDVTTGVAHAVAAAGPGLGAVRIDSGDLASSARQVRAQLDSLGAGRTKIVVSGDLDEYAIAALRDAPVDSYGVGTALVTGSGVPTAGFVYKLVEVDGQPVHKRSTGKRSQGGRKQALRVVGDDGAVIEEIVYPAAAGLPALDRPARTLAVPLVRAGEVVIETGAAALGSAREHLKAALLTLPAEGLRLEQGEPAIPTRAMWCS